MSKFIFGGILAIFLSLVAAAAPAQSNQIGQLPVIYRDLVTYEQLYNDRVENTKEFASIMQIDVSPQYWPERQPVIPLETVYVPLSAVTVVDTAGVLTSMIKSVNGVKSLPFFIHPDSTDLYAQEIEKYPAAPEYLATPTSSHRSMIIWPEDDPSDPLYIKLSINREIGGDLRILTNGQIERAAAVSYLLKTMNMASLETKGIHFIDEPFHVYLKSGKTGYSVRTLPRLPVGSTLVPMFALYSKHSPKIPGEPLIAKLIRESGQNPKVFVRRQIIQPLISQMVELSFAEGLVGDFHEQNVLMRLENGRLTGDFYYRDLAGFDINANLRAQAGKDMNFLPPDFPRDHLHFFRADPIQKIQDYLVNSNFYALTTALEGTPYEVSREWVDATVMRLLSAEIVLRTGAGGSTFSALKTAVTKYTHEKSDCRDLIGEAG